MWIEAIASAAWAPLRLSLFHLYNLIQARELFWNAGND